MGQAQKKLEQCILYGHVLLNLEGCDLKELPSNFPSWLTILYCINNCLEQLPINLPTSLIILDCSNNQIKSLPTNLPASLLILRCDDNYLEIAIQSARLS